MKKLLFYLLFLPGIAHTQTISVQYEMTLQLGKKAETLPRQLVMQINNIVIDFNYRFSQNKSECIFAGQRTKDPSIPPLYTGFELGVNVYKDLNTSFLYRTSNKLPNAVSRDFFPAWKWEIQSDETTEILGYTCRKAVGTDESGNTATVWYTYDIAVPDGPGVYCGLRGLILQVETDDFIQKAGSITIDPDIKTDIQMPAAQEYLTGDEFDKLKKRP